MDTDLLYFCKVPISAFWSYLSLSFSLFDNNTGEEDLSLLSQAA
jgi:hypothetical protein